MNVSSRWCVTAVFALGALACSDPVPPPAQGAFRASVRPDSPQPAGKTCPAAAFTYEVPSVEMATETLDELTYLHKVIDGESGASVKCLVKGSSTFTFSGRFSFGGKLLEIADGTLGADHKGTARITVKSQELSVPLISPQSNCVVDAAKTNTTNYQVKAGSMWAKYECPTVETPPSDSCKSDGFFVIENCDQ